MIRVGSAVARGCAALACAALALGCHRPEDEDLGLAPARTGAIALDKLTDPAVLVAALEQPGAALDAHLGARGFELGVTTELSSGATRDRIEQAIHFDSDGKGGFHLAHELDHPLAIALGPARGEGEAAVRDKVDPLAQGMEAVALPGRLFVRPRWARYSERPAEPGELDRLRALGEQVVADELELLAPFMTITDGGAGEVLGRRTHRLTLARSPAPRSPPKDDDPRHAWRAILQVDELTGALEVDAETGALLVGRLDARYRMRRDGEALSAHVALRQIARAAQPLVAPDDALASPHRPRPTLERNQLLEGLAPPVGTQGARAQ